MRKTTSFFVATLTILVFLSGAFAACGWSTVQSSAGPAPSPARHPVNQVYALAWAPDGTHLALGTKSGDIQLWNTRSKTLLLTTARHRHRASLGNHHAHPAGGL
jgi:WD40 repeat protein